MDKLKSDIQLELVFDDSFGEVRHRKQLGKTTEILVSRSTRPLNLKFLDVTLA